MHSCWISSDKFSRTALHCGLWFLDFEHLCKINVQSFKYDYSHSKLPLSFESMFKFLAEPNQTMSVKVEKVKNITSESFPTVVLPKI